MQRQSTWLAGGNIVYGAAQFLLLAALATFLTPSDVGEVAYALALATPLYLLTDLNLRISVATDAQHEVPTVRYRAFRRGSVVITAVALIVVLRLQTEGSAFLVGLMVVAYRAADSLSNLAYGFGLRSQNGDAVGRALAIRGLLGVVASLVLLAAGASAAVAVGGVAAIWLTLAVREWNRFGVGPLLSTDPLSWGAIRGLVKRTWSLGADGFVTSLHFNIPRFAVEQIVGLSALGVYATVGTLMNGVSIVAGAVSAIVVARMSKALADGRAGDVMRDLRLLVATGVVIAGGLLVFSITIWPPLLSLIGPEYADRDLLVAFALGVSLNIVGQFFAKPLQAARRFEVYLTIDTVAAATTGLTAWWLVTRSGAVGGAVAVALGGLARLVVTIPLTLRSVRASTSEAVGSD